MAKVRVCIRRVRISHGNYRGTWLEVTCSRCGLVKMAKSLPVASGARSGHHCPGSR